MDIGTELAIRAVICGLYHSDAIKAYQVRAVMSAINDAAGAALDRREADSSKALTKLRKGIHLDTAVSPSADDG